MKNTTWNPFQKELRIKTQKKLDKAQLSIDSIKYYVLS